jgi:uncharacterized membrane protein
MAVGHRRTRSQIWSDNIAEFCGSWGFVFWFSAGIVGWILLNTLLLVFGKWDEYPFILLNLFLTIISTMQSPIIMMAQNRQVERDRDYIRQLHRKLDKIIDGQKEHTEKIEEVKDELPGTS